MIGTETAGGAPGGGGQARTLRWLGRRHGHNEMDDPRATMPLTCAAIDSHPRVLQLYSNVLATRFQAPAAGVLLPHMPILPACCLDPRVLQYHTSESSVGSHFRCIA